MNTHWIQDFVKQTAQINMRSVWGQALSMAYKVLLSGFAIGFAFAAYLVLAHVGYIEFGIFSAALTLWLALEYLYADALFVFTGSMYLIFVAAVTSTALAVHLPTRWIMPVSIQTPSLYMFGLLVAMWLCRDLVKWYVRLFVAAYTQLFERIAVWFDKGMVDGKKQQDPA